VCPVSERSDWYRASEHAAMTNRQYLASEFYALTLSPDSSTIKIMKFYYVYVLKSKYKNFLYTGYTKDLRLRLVKHNSETVLSTKHYAPLELIFFEGYKYREDAKRREHYLKTTKGKTALNQMLKATLSNLISTELKPEKSHQSTNPQFPLLSY
jgi:putative endonuclease